MSCSKATSAKDSGDIPCVIKTLKSDEIRQYYDKKQYPQAFYLLAMVDYLSREHRLPLYNAYNDMRKQKLADPIYPQNILTLAKVKEDDSILSDSLEKAIPEFRRFDIAENEIWHYQYKSGSAGMSHTGAAAFIQYYDGNNTFDSRSAASILLSICGWQ